MVLLQDSFSSPNKVYYLMRTSNNNYDITADINKALRIVDDKKAKNILCSIPKVFRKYMWETIEDPNEYKFIDNESIDLEIEDISISEEDKIIKYNYDEILHNTKTTITQMTKELYDKQQIFKTLNLEYKRLNNMLSEIDKELSDIDHFLEFNVFSASKGYKIIALRQKKLNQRREIKDSIITYENILNVTSITKLTNAIEGIEGLGGRIYTPRTDVYDQLKYI